VNQGRFSPAWILLLPVMPLTGCSDSEPARITFTAPAGPIVDTKPFQLQGALMNKAGSSLPNAKISYSSNPSDVVTVTESGECRCLKSGDASVLIAGGGLSTLVGVKCRLVSALDVPREIRLVVGEPPDGFHATPLGENSAPISDVPVTLASSDQSVLRVEKQTLVPVAVGKTSLKSTAGPISSLTDVTVVENIISSPLLLNDGARQSWTLAAGTYEVDVKVAAELNKRDGVTITWLGSDCPNQAEKQLHHVRGHVTDTSALTIENPTAFGLGSAVNGYIKIVRVP